LQDGAPGLSDLSGTFLIVAVTFDVVLSEGRRALEQQHTDLLQVRARAAALVTWASAATTILGGLVLTSKQPVHLTGWAWAVAGSYLGLVATVVAVHWPRTMTLYSDPQILVEDYVPLPAHEAMQLLGEKISGWQKANGKVLDQLHWLYAAGLVLLCIETVSVLLTLKG
jgi:hypothetical protein